LFDIDADGTLDSLTWLAPGMVWLALDRNGNGNIDDGSELFGGATPGADGGSGYKGLAAFDIDGNGYVEQKEIPGLLLWDDANRNGRTDAGELVSAWSEYLAFGVRYVPRFRQEQYGQFAWSSWYARKNGEFGATTDVLLNRYPSGLAPLVP